MPERDLAEVAVVVVMFCVVLLIGVSIWSSMATITGQNTQDGERVQTSQALDGDSWETLSDTTGVNETVYNSRGYAVNLTGASDSYVQSDADINVATDQNWTVATWARVDADSANEQMTVISLEGRLILTYNGSAGDWSAWYYDDGSRDSYEVSVNATNQPANFTHLSATVNESTLTLYRDNTASASVDVTQSSTVSSPVNSTSFDGRLEETRTFDTVLNSSERAELVNSPLDPQVGLNRTARIMYDEPYRSSQLILFSDASLEQSNVTYSSGFEGQELDASEYTWNPSGPQISVAGLPVAYVDYTVAGFGPGMIVPELSSALGFAALIPLIVIVGLMITYLRDTQGR